MFDRAQFLRPIAHRGLHKPGTGIVENTMPAFEAAIAKGYAIECDVRPAGGGLPIVFHDEDLQRLLGLKRRADTLTSADLSTLRYIDRNVPIATLGELLRLVQGQVPLVVEIKSEWEPPDLDFLRQCTTLAQSYKGPIALMSFDPAVMAVVRKLAPRVPAGIVSGSFSGFGWWGQSMPRARAAALRDLLESRPVHPDFYAYEVNALPTPVTRYVREVLGIPLLTWTVRNAKQRKIAAEWADAPIFEGFEP